MDKKEPYISRAGEYSGFGAQASKVPIGQGWYVDEVRLQRGLRTRRGVDPYLLRRIRHDRYREIALGAFLNFLAFGLPVLTLAVAVLIALRRM